MTIARKQRWQQATALVSLSTAGAMTGIGFAHGTVADITSPTGMPAHLLAFAKPARPTSAGDGALRSAIVRAAQHYLRLAQGMTPAQMEALIWQNVSSDGADHGESCAAFASLTLEAGAQATGQQSWVTGGTSYPWPLHGWADVRVDLNPQSPGIVSVVQDAEANHRWHPLGDGYTPQPGDWVVFPGHVEVVTQYAGGVLSTIGGDSMPNLSVNAHQYDDPLGAQGVAGFVNNGQLLSAGIAPAAAAASAPATAQQPAAGPSDQGQAYIPGPGAPDGNANADGLAPGVGPSDPSNPAPGNQLVALGAAAIPGPRPNERGPGGSASPRYTRNPVTPSPAQAGDTLAQQAFIREVAPGAVAAQRQYGVPAAVTIAQAIDESGWGQSQLAAQDRNLFGIKGSGPAGSVVLPTQEFENGQWVTVSAPFRVYNSVAESVNDHSLLLATGSSYKQAMADRADPDAFANDLTGVYATDPSYGANLISIMRLYNLYRYSAANQAAPQGSTPVGPAFGPALQSGTWQNGPDIGSGATAGSAPGIGGYGPALGTAGSGAPLSAAGGSMLGAGGGGMAAAAARHGPALGAAGGAAVRTAGGALVTNEALQSASSRAAAIPGTAQPGGPGTSGAAASTAGWSAVRAEAQGAGASRPRHPQAGPVATEKATSAATGRATSAATGRATSAGTGRVRPGSLGPRSSEASGAGLATTGGSRATRQRSAGLAAPQRRAAGAAAVQPARLRNVSGRAGSSVATGARQTAAGAGPASSGPSRPSNLSGGSAIGAGSPLGGARIPGAPSVNSGVASRSGGGQVLRAGPRNLRISTRRYVPQMPRAVTTAFIATAKTPLMRSELLYREVASETGVRWQLLAACDWMQCQAQPRVSPVYGEKLGTKNADGTVYRSRSEALTQCARDLIILAGAVYGIELTDRLNLSVRDLAKVFAAFRWGGLLVAHHISALDFPYSVAGLTVQYVKMRWPDVPEAPGSDKPGSRFHKPFGAVPVVLGLGFRAVA